MIQAMEVIQVILFLMSMQSVVSSVMSFLTFPEFATKYKLTKNKLEQCMSDHIVPNIFPTYSSNPKGQHYSLYCKFQLLRSKPWKNSINDAWGTTEPDDQTYITEWHNFLNTAYAKKHFKTGLKRFQMY